MIFINTPVIKIEVPSRISRYVLSKLNIRRNSFSIRYNIAINKLIARRAASNP
jgi:hypothetical protein